MPGAHGLTLAARLEQLDEVMGERVLVVVRPRRGWSRTKGEALAERVLTADQHQGIGTPSSSEGLLKSSSCTPSLAMVVAGREPGRGKYTKAWAKTSSRAACEADIVVFGGIAGERQGCDRRERTGYGPHARMRVVGCREREGLTHGWGLMMVVRGQRREMHRSETVDPGPADAGCEVKDCETVIAGGIDVTRDLEAGRTKLPSSFSGESFSKKPWDSGAVAGGDYEPGHVNMSSSSSLLDLLREGHSAEEVIKPRNKQRRSSGFTSRLHLTRGTSPDDDGQQMRLPLWFSGRISQPVGSLQSSFELDGNIQAAVFKTGPDWAIQAPSTRTGACLGLHMSSCLSCPIVNSPVC
ncbi:hypothetical protein L227DRAFT_630104 [Lentinus tigrinus ALCF2SS1-6]|uniref:Uncharacterized protein n=1 Tax=Lentinus tigrinus ALCF2SS1-6 TaxID=1328759 RepID=A0A5C2S5Q4_9APHY|nr:hypothetical protein L227DRAFT_630104 [Lentinus tigrinus ALCF2SS1-6]